MWCGGECCDAFGDEAVFVVGSPADLDAEFVEAVEGSFGCGGGVVVVEVRVAVVGPALDAAVGLAGASAA